MSEQDHRPWRTVTFKLPEPVACQLESAINLLEIAGKASNRIEAIEAMAVGVMHEELSGLLIQARHESKTHERMQRWVGLFNAGWRCLICGTSRDLQCHHITPRSQGGNDEEPNLAPLCAADHQRITDNRWPWEQAKAWLEQAKLDRLREVNSNGWVRKRDRTGEIERFVRGNSLQGEQMGGDSGELEHSTGAMAVGE